MSRIMGELMESARNAMSLMQDKSMLEAIERFQEMHPGVEVEIVFDAHGKCLGAGEKGKGAPVVPVRPCEIKLTFGGEVVATIKWP